MKAFIDENKGTCGVEPICKTRPIAPSTYYAHAARQRDPAKAPARVQGDVMLSEHIRRVREENFRACGVRKVWRPLLREGRKGSSDQPRRLLEPIRSIPPADAEANCYRQRAGLAMAA